MSSGSAYKEGTPLAAFGSSNSDRSYSRILASTDSDSNSADFSLVVPSGPTNRTLCAPEPTSPSAVGSAAPGTVTPGTSTLLMVSVVPGTFPASSGLTATGDLSAIGGSAAQLFFDDGTHGDVTTADGIFTWLAAVPPAATTGSYSLPINVNDEQGRSTSTWISLTVTAAPVVVSEAKVVINEFRTRGPSGGWDEFIELRNMSTEPVDIGGWTVFGSNASVTTVIRSTLSAFRLGPGCTYLLGNSRAEGGYSGIGSGREDQTYGLAIADDGGIALLDLTGAIVDAVGLSSGSAYREGSPLPHFGDANSDRS